MLAIANPVNRNLEITYCYSRLSAAFACVRRRRSELVHVCDLGLSTGRS